VSDPTGSSSGTPPSRRLLRAALLAIAALAVVAYGVRFCARGNDFLAYYGIGTVALQRGDIYAPSPTNGMWVFYAPHFSLMMIPFALLPPFVAGFLWFAAKVAVLAWVARELAGEIRATAAGAQRPRLWPAHLVLPFLVAVNPLIGEMKLGQVNLFVFALTLLAQRSIEAGRTWRAAGLFSIALLKVTPWVFVPWFVVRRQWRLLGALAAVGAGWLGALALWFGPGQVIPIFQAWMVTARTHKLGIAEVAYLENQSLQGVSARLATAFPALVEPVLGVPAYRLLWMPFAALLFALVLAFAWRDRFRPVLPRAEFAFLCCVMILCSPDSRWAHQMQLLAPFGLLAAAAARVNLFSTAGGGGASRAWRRGVGVVVALGLVFQVVLTRDVVGKRLDNAARWWSAHFVFAVALTGLIAAVLLRRRALPSRSAGVDEDPLGLRAAIPVAAAAPPSGVAVEPAA
jgi:hypothetical protein